jgi:hypothetical protein
MRDLSASIPVKAPSGFALAFLNTYVSDLAGTAGGGSKMAMRYTITHLAGLTLERDVCVRVEYVPGTTGATAELEITWEPDASLFPRFNGALHALAAGKETCTLSLQGTYDVPGGVAGQLFDAVIGVRIANGTLENLLARFRDAIEDDYKKRMVFA